VPLSVELHPQMRDRQAVESGDDLAGVLRQPGSPRTVRHGRDRPGQVGRPGAMVVGWFSRRARKVAWAVAVRLVTFLSLVRTVAALAVDAFIQDFF